MRKVFRALITRLAITTLMAPPVLAAGPPAAQQSVFTSPICVSPRNVCAPPEFRCRFEGTLRDAQGMPVPNFPASMVLLDFEACSNPSTRPADRIPADENSDANGLVYWEVGLNFGGADPCAVQVRVQNQIFATIPNHQALPPEAIDGGVRSVDQNGDGLIALGDLSVFQQEFVNTGQRLDYRGDEAPPFDGLTSLGDLAWMQKHFTTPCP